MFSTSLARPHTRLAPSPLVPQTMLAGSSGVATFRGCCTAAPQTYTSHLAAEHSAPHATFLPSGVRGLPQTTPVVHALAAGSSWPCERRWLPQMIAPPPARGSPCRDRERLRPAANDRASSTA